VSGIVARFQPNLEFRNRLKKKKNLQYLKISWKSVQRETRFIRADRREDRHEEANSRFSLFTGMRLKMVTKLNANNDQRILTTDRKQTKFTFLVLSRTSVFPSAQDSPTSSVLRHCAWPDYLKYSTKTSEESLPITQGNIPEDTNPHQHPYRCADKSLARPGRKQARKHFMDVRDFNNIKTRGVIKIFPCKARRLRKFTPF